MNLAVPTPESTEKQVLRLFEEILATLPGGHARIESKSPRKGITELALVPANERSAECGAVFFDRDLYSIFFGHGKRFTTYECPWEIKLMRSDGVDKHLVVLQRICLAVIAGRCEHRYKRWGLQGTIQVSEKEIYTMTDVGLLSIFRPRRTTEVVRYEPYYPGGEGDPRARPKLSL